MEVDSQQKNQRTSVSALHVAVAGRIEEKLAGGDLGLWHGTRDEQSRETGEYEQLAR